jgi:hypothetical protein
MTLCSPNLASVPDDALIFILSPLGFFFARVLDLPMAHRFIAVALFALPVGPALYYLAWNLVDFLDIKLGIA